MDSDNPRALYERLGFVEVGVGGDEVLMRWADRAGSWSRGQKNMHFS